MFKCHWNFTFKLWNPGSKQEMSTISLEMFFFSSHFYKFYIQLNPRPRSSAHIYKVSTDQPNPGLTIIEKYA